MDIIATLLQARWRLMHPIQLVSIIGLGIMIERFIFLYFKYNINASAFMAQIQKLVMANNIDRAIKLAARHHRQHCPRPSASCVPTRALRKSRTLLKKRRSRSCQSSLSAQPSFNRSLTSQRSSDFSGTILGLIAAFDALKNPNIPADQRQSMLAGGIIAMAMNTTAFGLIVAIPRRSGVLCPA